MERVAEQASLVVLPTVVPQSSIMLLCLCAVFDHPILFLTKISAFMSSVCTHGRVHIGKQHAIWWWCPCLCCTTVTLHRMPAAHSVCCKLHSWFRQNFRQIPVARTTRIVGEAIQVISKSVMDRVPQFSGTSIADLALGTTRRGSVPIGDLSISKIRLVMALTVRYIGMHWTPVLCWVLFRQVEVASGRFLWSTCSMEFQHHLDVRLLTEGLLPAECLFENNKVCCIY